MSIPLLTLSLGLSLIPGGAPPDGGWRLVVPPPDDPMAHAPLRAVALSDRKPPDVKESAPYRGGRRRYAQLTYGTGRAAAVTVVVDEVAPGEIDLYLDADRNRNITAADRLTGTGLTWRARVTAVVPDGDATRELTRTVLFRYGPVSRTLAVATCGYVEGRAALDGREVTVRRVDGDANGLFADPQDRVWIDRSGDGTWNAAADEFLFAPILRLDGRRLAVRADALGERLGLVPLEGTGTLRLKLPPALKPEQVDEVQATVQSRDGVVASLRGLGSEIALPAAEYRLSSLLLTLKDPQGGAPWGYVFNDNGGKGYRWRRLDPSGSLALDPVGSLVFSAAVGDGEGVARAGESVSVRPALHTGDGLLIERAYRGSFQSNAYDSGCAGVISLIGDGGQVLETARSGFA
jgi:hypothetical protein